MAYINIHYLSKSGYVNEPARETEIEAVVQCTDVITSIKTINKNGLFDVSRKQWIPPHKIVKIEFNEDDYYHAKG